MDTSTPECLTGKAREVYSALSVEQSSRYDSVKSEILKAYEPVPEAYRQQFRNSHKEDSQTFTEFAREKEVQFDRWCASKEVNHDFNKLRQLILLEEFKSCVSAHIKTYLDERNAGSLHQAAVLAEDYSLTHKGTFSKDAQSGAGSRGNHSGEASSSASGKSSNDTRQLDGLSTMCQCAFTARRRATLWLNVGNKRRRLPGPTRWLYLIMYNQSLTADLCHCLYMRNLTPLCPGALFHCQRKEYKCQLQS